MRTHTKAFKETIKELGRQIDGKIYYYPNYNLITESGDTILTETDIELVSQQFDKSNAIEIDSSLIYSMNIIKNGQLLQSLMKELDIELKYELNVGSVINAQFGLLVNNNYEYLDYGNYVVYSKEFNLDTETWNYVCYDMMLYSMIKYRPLSITYPITIRDFINAIATKMGVGFANSSDIFVNYDQLINEDVFKNKGYTLRDVLDKLSQITASNILINDDDELEVSYINDMTTKLPNGYTQVDYIQSSGTQYIDSGILPSENIGFEIDFTPHNDMNSTSSARTIFGSRTNYKTNGYQLTTYTTSSLNGGHFLFGTDNTASNIRHSAYMQKDVRCQISFLNGVFKVANGNGTNIQGTFSNVNKNIYLFGCIENVNPFELSTTTLYNLKFYDNNVLVRDFIPCYRNSDNVVGLYDLVNDVFYTNQGSGAFTYGMIAKEKINEEYLKNINVAFGKSFGPINRISITDTDNDLNYYSEDNMSIKQNGKTQINIIDNELAFNGEEQIIANNILTKLNGLYYLINDFETTGVCYFDYLDLFNVEAKGNTYQCLLLNNEISISQGIKESIFTEELEDTETNSKNYETSIMSNKYVSFKINQQEGKIESKVEKDGVISAINQSAEEIKIQANKLSFEGATIDMTADNIKIRGNNLDIDSDGMITLMDNTADESQIKNASYKIESNYDEIFQGDSVHVGYVHQIFANGRQDEYENDNNISGSSGYGHYFGGINENLYRYPITTWYMKSADFVTGYTDGSYTAISVGVQGINTSRLLNGTWTYGFSVSVDGDITCHNIRYSGSLTPVSSSIAEKKKNFEKLTNAKEILNETDIYKYNMKEEKNTDKKHIGFVIGEDFNYSKEITLEDNTGVNIYSMVSVLWQVVKEQQKEIQELKEMIKNG